jgi:uncharacterized protein YggT (Ycf19 family)
MSPNPTEPARPTPPAPPLPYRRDVVQQDVVSPAFGIAWGVYLALGIVVGLIIIRVILKALAANTHAGFTSFVYGVTQPLVTPFQGIFATQQTSNGSVFEFSSVVAIVVYALVAWAIVSLAAAMGQRRTTTRY